MSAVLRKILAVSLPRSFAKEDDSTIFENDIAMLTPTINKKKGKTRSVGVQPCHLACRNGA